MIHKKITESTFDVMNVHLKTITALGEKILVTNFHMAKNIPSRKSNLRKIKFLRVMELKEK